MDFTGSIKQICSDASVCETPRLLSCDRSPATCSSRPMFGGQDSHRDCSPETRDGACGHSAPVHPVLGSMSAGRGVPVPPREPAASFLSPDAGALPETNLGQVAPQDRCRSSLCESPEQPVASVVSRRSPFPEQPGPLLLVDTISARVQAPSAWQDLGSWPRFLVFQHLRCPGATLGAAFHSTPGTVSFVPAMGCRACLRSGLHPPIAAQLPLHTHGQQDRTGKVPTLEVGLWPQVLPGPGP